jgi:hypothetical protein
MELLFEIAQSPTDVNSLPTEFKTTIESKTLHLDAVDDFGLTGNRSC